jgi:hypothetical protein
LSDTKYSISGFFSISSSPSAFLIKDQSLNSTPFQFLLSESSKLLINSEKSFIFSFLSELFSLNH